MYRYIIVDDEVLIRKGLISKIKDITSIQIACAGEAANGIEGLALIEAEDPDIIITDMKMTKMDGMEFLEKIAEHYPDKPIIVIRYSRNIPPQNLLSSAVTKPLTMSAKRSRKKRSDTC